MSVSRSVDPTNRACLTFISKDLALVIPATDVIPATEIPRAWRMFHPVPSYAGTRLVFCKMKKQFTRIFRYLYSPHHSSAERADLRSRQDASKGSAHRQRPARSLTVNLGFRCCLAAATLAVRKRARAVHRRLIAHLRGQCDPRPAAILDWLRNISPKGPGHHRVQLRARLQP